MDVPFLVLCAVVALGMGVQTAVGFGSILVSVTLGVHWVPLSELLPLVVPVSLVQSTVIAVRHRRDIATPMLVKRVLPLVGLGVLISVVAVGPGQASWLRPALGVLVLALALLSLATEGTQRRHHTVTANVALFAGGIVQGLLATGGPLVVFGLSREAMDRKVLRTTLCALWACMNAVVVVAMALDGRVNQQMALQVAVLLVPAAFGMVVGEAVHGRLDEATFRRTLWAILALAALPLLLT